jgi:hypothetical protein
MCSQRLFYLFMQLNSEFIVAFLHNVKIRENAELGVYVQDLSHEYVGSVVDVYALMGIGDLNKKKCATKMNPNSSRSHW